MADAAGERSAGERPEAAWHGVLLGDARQIARFMGVPEERWPDAALDVRGGYRAWRASGDLPAAIDYLAHALPRVEAIAWAARILDDGSRRHELERGDRHALDTALRWVGEPGEAYRRAAGEAADRAGRRSPERCLALAVFASGGSIAPPGMVPIAPPPEAVPRYVAGAIKQAAYRGDDAERAFRDALTLGEAVAERGAAAVATRTGA